MRTKTKSLSSSLKKEKLEGVTSLETKKLADQLLKDNDDVDLSLDFLHNYDEKQKVKKKKEDDYIMLKNNQFIFIELNNIDYILHDINLPVPASNDEDIVDVFERNLLGQWTIDHQQPLSPDAIDSILYLSLHHNKRDSNAAKEYFIAIFQQMVNSSLHIEWLFSLKQFHRCLSVFNVHPTIINNNSNQSSDEVTESLRDSSNIDLDGLKSFMEILEVVFTSYYELQTLVNSDSQAQVKSDLVEIVRELMIICCDEQIQGSLQHQIEQVLNIVLLHCSDFEYLDDPIKASEHDPLRYYNPQPNSMCELLSAMLKNLASNTELSELDLYDLCTLRIDNIPLQCFIYDCVLGYRYRFKSFIVEFSWNSPKPFSRIINFVQELVVLAEDEDTLATLIKNNVQWWIQHTKIVEALKQLISEFDEIFNHSHYSEKIMNNSRLMKTIIDSELKALK